MYSVTDNGILKIVETWSVIIPLYDNDKQRFEKSSIDSILEEILLNYPGFSLANSIGYWKGKDQTYIDKNHEVLIDAVPDNVGDSSQFFINLKRDLQTRLRQEKIYVTKQGSKEEVLTFDEFFDEIGIQSQTHNKKEEARQLAQQLAGRLDFVTARLGYETTALRRDEKRKKIIWERMLCGIRLRSVLDDSLPHGVKIVAADQVSELSDVIVGETPFAVIGGYEFESFVLEKQAYRNLTEVDDSIAKIKTGYCLPTGEQVPARRIIEEFTAAVFINCMVLRDEGFFPDEIKINVGQDGSLQIGTNTQARIVLHSPAFISSKRIQRAILKCLKEVLDQYDTNTLDPIAIMQAKAKNNYILKRAFVRKTLQENKKC